MNKRMYLGLGLLLPAIAILVLYIYWNSKPSSQAGSPEHLTGWVPSDPEDLARFPVVDTNLLATPDMELPLRFELEMPPVIDQGNEGSCCACACAYSARSYLLHKDQQIAYTNDAGSIDPLKIFSPEFVYNSAREAQPADCSKAGMKLTHAVELIKSKGVAPWAFMPYSGANGCSVLPDSAQWNAAAMFKVKKAERIAQTSERVIKQVIFSRNPVIFSARIDAGFMKNGSDVWAKSDPYDLGGHAMVLCGWDDSKHAYKVMNSWGSGWGDNGFGWIDYDHFSKVVRGNKWLYEMFILSNGYDSTLLPVISTAMGYQYSNTLFNGEIVTQGAAPITECGICYSTSPQPTINDLREDGTLENDQIYCNPLEGLQAGKTYYIRAYAKNPYGTAYGNEIRFNYNMETARRISPDVWPGRTFRTGYCK